MARILVVEDDGVTRTTLRAVLGRAGYDVVLSADSSVELLQHLQRGVDVVVTDLHMPEVHGFQLLAYVRTLSPRPPVIVLSGTGAPQLEMAAAMGAFDTLEKPLDPGSLLDAVRRAVAAGPTEDT